MKDKIPLWFKVVYVLSIIVSFHFFLPQVVKEKVMVNEDIKQVNKVVYNSVPRDLIDNKVISTFVGELTGYGPDCYGCSGRTASGMNVKNGNIYYYDDLFGELRIVAADKKYKFGTVLRITASNVFDYPIIAIVLDRGGLIRGNKFDLLFENEQATKFVGRQKNVKYEVLRNGW